MSDKHIHLKRVSRPVIQRLFCRVPPAGGGDLPCQYAGRAWAGKRAGVVPRSQAEKKQVQGKQHLGRAWAGKRARVIPRSRAQLKIVQTNPKPTY